MPAFINTTCIGISVYVFLKQAVYVPDIDISNIIAKIIQNVH